MKRNKDLDPLEFDASALGFAGAGDNDALAEMFDDYFEPKVGDSEVEGETFLEAVDRDNRAIKDDLHRADEHQNKRIKNAEAEIAAGGDVDYYCCLVFVTEAQKRQFLSQAGWEQFADEAQQYVNGVALAKHLGVKLDHVRLVTSSNPDKKLVEAGKRGE